MTIRLDSVGFSYGRGQSRVVIAEALSLSIQAGQIAAVVGPSGCGKSTILRLIAGLIQPQRGTISIDGEAPEILRRKGAFGVVFQSAALLPWRTVNRNVQLPLELNGAGRNDLLVNEALERVGLQSWANHLPHQLSGGMQQRVALARALVAKPRLVLLDEPFSQLDELLRYELLFHVQSYAQERGATILLVTHDISEAVLAADVVFVLSSRPIRPLDVLPVDLGTPRCLSCTDTPAYQSAVASVRKALLSEIGQGEVQLCGGRTGAS